MQPISIELGHNKHLIVVSLLDVKIEPDTGANGINHGIHFFVLHDILALGFLRIQNFPA